MEEENKDWKNLLEGFVFKTSDSFKEEEEEEIETLDPNQQELHIKYEKKGRGGKQVTIVTNFVGSEEDFKKLGKELKKKCGVGGSSKNGEIVMQGDLRVKIQEILKKLGYKVKKIGG